MAESGFFRSSLRGFNKQDVLEYIDEIQTAHGTALAQADAERREAEELLSREREQNADNASMIKELEASNTDLRDQVEKLTALAQIYKAELLALREQKTDIEQNKIDSTKLEQMQARNRELEDECIVLKEQNARYASVVGDVSRLVVEARIVSASYLDAAHQKSEECIQQLDLFLSELKGKVERVREGANANRRAGDVRIESLLSDLQDLGETLPKN